MTREEGKYINSFNEECKKWDKIFFQGERKHILSIHEYKKYSFCILFDNIDIWGFNSLENAMNFWLWFTKGFRYCKEEIAKDINKYFNS